MIRHGFCLLFLCTTALPLSAADDLRVAFGEVDVSPKLEATKPICMAGFGHNRIATEIHDPIMARVVVLSSGEKKIALVAVDVVGLFLPFVESIREQLPGFAYVLVGSTHNHEGPDTLGLWGKTPFQSGIDEAYMKSMRDKIVDTIKKSSEKLQPCRVRIAKRNLPDLLHDGRLPIVKHDELTVLEFQNPADNKPIGLLVNWHCHPETLGSQNMKISADFVASTVATLKKQQNCPVAYFTGTVGGLMTSLDVPIKNAKGEALQDGTYEKTEAYGRAIAEQALSGLQKAEPITLVPLEIQTKKILLPVDNPIYKAGWQLGVLKRAIYLWRDDPYEAKPTPATDSKPRLAIQTEIGRLKLGELDIAVIPGEIYPELVLGKIQDPADPGADFPEAPKEPSIHEVSKSKHRVLFGLGNDEIGYIIPKRQWDEKEPYCYGLKKPQYGEINSLGPETAPILMKAFAELVK